MPFNPLKKKERYKLLIENDEAIEFSHTLEEQIGGQLKAGFILNDLYEDFIDRGFLKAYAPIFIATLAKKP